MKREEQRMSKVAVFAGHGTSQSGSWDSGCVYGKYTEAALVAKITASCVRYLKASGVEVITDVPDNRINMVKQVARSNSEGVKLHVAFHCDYSKAPAGTIPLYTSARGCRLAKLMNKYVLKYSSLTTRGVAKRTDLYELNATDAPAVIFEVGSIKQDLKTMIREYDAIGFGAAIGILEYLGVESRPKQYKLLAALDAVEHKVISQHYKYKNSANLNKKTINCAEYISWGLRKIGILAKGHSIWLGKLMHGSGTSDIKKHCKVSHPNKKWNSCDLKIGDVVGFQWGNSKVHTMALLRFRGGYPVWATCGSSDIKAKNLSRRRTKYEKLPIKTLIRMK